MTGSDGVTGRTQPTTDAAGQAEALELGTDTCMQATQATRLGATLLRSCVLGAACIRARLAAVYAGLECWHVYPSGPGPGDTPRVCGPSAEGWRAQGACA